MCYIYWTELVGPSKDLDWAPPWNTWCCMYHLPRNEDPDPVLFSTDPDPDPTYNDGFMKLFLSWTKYKSETTNSSIKLWVIISNFIPTYLKYQNIFFFISISGRIRSQIWFRIRNFFSAEPDPGPWKKMSDPSVEKNVGSSTNRVLKKSHTFL